MAKLYYNELEGGFSLDNLSKKYLPADQRKSIDILIDSAINNDLVLKPKRENYNVDRFRDKVKKWCYANLDKIPQEDLASYCNKDIISTGQLFLKFIGER
jgi:hypothetical protein